MIIIVIIIIIISSSSSRSSSIIIIPYTSSTRVFGHFRPHHTGRQASGVWIKLNESEKKD